MWVSAGRVPYYEGNKASNSSFENNHISKPLHVITSTTNESYLLILDLYKKRGQTQMIRLHAVKQFLAIRTAAIDLLGAWPKVENSIRALCAVQCIWRDMAVARTLCSVLYIIVLRLV